MCAVRYYTMLSQRCQQEFSSLLSFVSCSGIRCAVPLAYHERGTPHDVSAGHEQVVVDRRKKRGKNRAGYLTRAKRCAIIFLVTVALVYHRRRESPEKQSPFCSGRLIGCLREPENPNLGDSAPCRAEPFGAGLGRAAIRGWRAFRDARRPHLLGFNRR